MMNSKKGTSALAAVFVIAIVIMAGGFVYWLATSARPQSIAGTAAGGGAEGTSTQSLADVLGQGDTATLKLTAQDAAFRSATIRLGLPVYCWITAPEARASTTNILGGTAGVTLDTTTAGGNTISGTERGDTVRCDAFNASYQGAQKDFTIKGTSLSDQVKVYQTSAYLKVIPINYLGQSDEDGIREFDHNITIGPNGNEKFRYQVENNQSNTIFRLAAIAIDLPPNSNISKVEMSEDVEQNNLADTSPVKVKRGSMLQRLTEYNYIFYFSQGNKNYVELGDNDYIRTGNILFEADGDGCNTRNANGEASATIAWIDEAGFQRLSGDSRNEVAHGLEDDAPSPADVGRADITRTLKCNAS